ncbi:MAG: hypothetical protein ACPL06_03245 [Candidatus Anstonellales archaeon]
MDVHIIGLGSSGSIAAISALRKGYEVHVSEQEGRAGESTVCTGLVSKETINFLQKYIDTEKIILQKIDKAVLHFGENKIEIKHRDGAYVVDRKKMDFLLAEKAEREGADVNLGERVDRISQYKAKNIIGADGANSVVAQHFRFPEIKKFVLTATARTEDRIAEKQSVYLYFNDYTKGFFSWVVDQGKKQEVGCGVILPNNVEHAFEKFCRDIKVKIKIKESAVIPLEVRKKTGIRKNGVNVLLIGDAAGHVKAFSGGGLAYGLRIAELSAGYIQDPEGYEKEWKKRYGPALMQFSFLQKMNEMLPSPCIVFGAGMLNFFGIGRLLEKRKMDNPLGI